MRVSMAASNYGPVRNLDHLGAARPRRLSMREAIEARAKQAQALVTARAECECAATRERERAEAERAAELAAELRAERELARFQRQLDAEARQDDRRVARILREFTRELDRQAKRERNAARRKARRERARRHREYLAREARRAAARRKRYSLVWRGSQPPAWAGTPATQPSARSRDLTPQPAPKPDTLTATVAEYIAASERACAALLPLLDACEPELETRRFDPEDYTNPDRGAYSGSALEVRHMDRDDLDLYDETQRDELAWVYLGHNAVVRPTHASVAAQALGACPPELEARTDWAALEATCNVRIPEGAAPGSLTPERARELMRVGSAPAQPAKPELRF